MGANNEKTLVFLMSTKLNFEKLYFCNKKYIEKLLFCSKKCIEKSKISCYTIAKEF